MMAYRVSRDTLSAILSDGAVLLSLATKRYFSLNGTGTRVWTLLEQGFALEEIVARLTREYDVDELEARRATEALVADLVAERFLEALPA
jgi:hypothetical protein